jgi:hypothetical protein
MSLHQSSLWCFIGCKFFMSRWNNGATSFGRRPFDRQSFGRHTARQWIKWLRVLAASSKYCIGQMSVGKMSVGQIVFDEKTCSRKNGSVGVVLRTSLILWLQLKSSSFLNPLYLIKQLTNGPIPIHCDNLEFQYELETPIMICAIKIFTDVIIVN